MMDKVYPKQYYLFLQKFNEGEYYECHDLLEEIWLEEKTNKFLQGLLQLSVGLYHLGYGNIKGARWMFANARQYLSRYAPVYWDLDVERVIAYLDQCLAALPPEDTIPYEQVASISVPYMKLSLIREA